jgi:N6-adenosine-specific RNA methylase IME4
MLTQRVSEDAFLFLWAPNSLVLDGSAQKVCEGWGFKPKQLITWVKTSKNGKPRLGGGHYTRVCTEQMILARRGKAKVRDRSVPGVIHAERTRHSAKPDESYELIERLCEGPYLELYARRQYPNWSAWGDQLEAA